LEFQRRLGKSWTELAVVLDIPDHAVAQFTNGHEASDIWNWLQIRKELHTLPPALIQIGRHDLADLLGRSDQ
jgi:hypothetical protein